MGPMYVLQGYLDPLGEAPMQFLLYNATILGTTFEPLVTLGGLVSINGTTFLMWL